MCQSQSIISNMLHTSLLGKRLSAGLQGNKKSSKRKQGFETVFYTTPYFLALNASTVR